MDQQLLAQLNGADDEHMGLQALVPRGGNPKLCILTGLESKRVILMKRRDKENAGAWEYFVDLELAFNHCCLSKVGVEEKLKHFCNHPTIFRCLAELVEESEAYGLHV